MMSRMPTRTARAATPHRRPQGKPRHETKLVALTPSCVSEEGTFEGYASLFDVPDLSRDVVLRGAFAQSLIRRPAASVRMLWQHDPSEPIGTWFSLVEDSRGLRARGRLNLAVARAREAHALLREGGIDGLSIGFRAERSRREPGSGRRLIETIDLWEISIVTFPMLPNARVSAVKRMPDLASAFRDAARQLFG